MKTGNNEWEKCDFRHTNQIIDDWGLGYVLQISNFELLIFSDGGKTCLLNRYANDSWYSNFRPTRGYDFKIKNIELDGKKIKLQVL